MSVKKRMVSSRSAVKTVGNKSKTQKRGSKADSAHSRPKGLSKPVKKALTLPSKVVNYSLCIPTSILNNCSNLDQITHTLYQVAKSATLFNVSEIVVLNVDDETLDKDPRPRSSSRESESSKKKLSRPMLILTLLQYFITPPYLASLVFKKRYNGYFKTASKLPRLSALPFMRHFYQDSGRYREGLSIPMSKPSTASKTNKSTNLTNYINIGKSENLQLKDQMIPANVRVTIDTLERKVVSPHEAYGDYAGPNSSYGYHLRIASSFADVFLNSIFSTGYTHTIWINSGDFYYNDKLRTHCRRDLNIPSINNITKNTLLPDNTASNLLLFFGKWQQIQKSFKNSTSQFEGAEGAHSFFDAQLNLPGAAPNGYICTEDSCMVALACLTANLITP